MPPSVACPWLSTQDILYAAPKATSCSWPLLAALSHRPPGRVPLCLFAARSEGQLYFKDQCDQGPHPGRNPMSGDRNHLATEVPVA